MIALLMVMLVPQAQESIEDRIAAFVKGEGGAREALLQGGAAAIRPLQGAREKAPEKIDALVFEIKKAAAWPAKTRAADVLEVKCKLDMRNQRPADVIAYLQEFAGAALICDRFEPADLKARQVDVVMPGDATVRQALDQLCRAAGLDYGFFHNVIVIGMPDRLWPSGKTPGAFGPPAVERQHRTPEDDRTLEQLRKIKINLDFQGARVTDMAAYMKEIASIGFEVEDPAGKPISTFRVKDLSVADVAALVTQTRDLDFIVREGKVIIGPRADIAKRLAK